MPISDRRRVSQDSSHIAGLIQVSSPYLVYPKVIETGSAGLGRMVSGAGGR